MHGERRDVCLRDCRRLCRWLMRHNDDYDWLVCVRFLRRCEWWPDSQCNQGSSDSWPCRQDSRAEASAKSSWSVVSETLTPKGW